MFGPVLVDNNVKQDEVMNPILLCIYVDGLLNLLAAAQIGYFTCKVFVGCLAHADDSFISAHNRGYDQHACDLSFVCKQIRLSF